MPDLSAIWLEGFKECCFFVAGTGTGETDIKTILWIEADCLNLEYAPLYKRMSAKTVSDNEILDGLRGPAPERATYENALYLRYAYFIDEGVRTFRLTREDAFSCYSDAVIRVIEHVAGNVFEGRSSLKTYLYQIFHNKCVDQVRKNTTHKSEVHQSAIIPEMLTALSDTSKSILQRLADRSDIEDLKRRLGELGDACRRMLLLSADGWTDKQIAAEMNFKNAGVAKTSRLRCMEKLRRLYTFKSS